MHICSTVNVEEARVSRARIVSLVRSRQDGRQLGCQNRRREDIYILFPLSAYSLNQMIPGCHADSPNGLTLLLLNARSLNNKILLIQDVIWDEHADLACYHRNLVGRGDSLVHLPTMFQDLLTHDGWGSC